MKTKKVLLVGIFSIGCMQALGINDVLKKALEPCFSVSYQSSMMLDGKKLYYTSSFDVSNLFVAQLAFIVASQFKEPLKEALCQAGYKLAVAGINQYLRLKGS